MEAIRQRKWAEEEARDGDDEVYVQAGNARPAQSEGSEGMICTAPISADAAFMITNSVNEMLLCMDTGNAQRFGQLFSSDAVEQHPPRPSTLIASFAVLCRCALSLQVISSVVQCHH